MKKQLFILSLILLNNACTTIATGAAEATGLSVLHDRRTSEALLRDEKIEIDAGIALNADDEIRDKAHINVTAYNGIVLVTGEAPSESLRTKIISIIRTIPGVKIVHDEIVIAQPTPITSRSYDTLLTTKVKSAISEIRNIPGFDATRIKVVTENGVVYLMGLVHPNEGYVAGEMARRVNGVKQVVKIFEYIDGSIPK
jgi:osmotically-inducible protein OsmY